MWLLALWLWCSCVVVWGAELPSVVESEPRMIPQSFPGRCRRAPPGVAIPKVPGDNGFYIKISGNPDKYVPGELYTGELWTYVTVTCYNACVQTPSNVEKRFRKLTLSSGEKRSGTR